MAKIKKSKFISQDRKFYIQKNNLKDLFAGEAELFNRFKKLLKNYNDFKFLLAKIFRLDQLPPKTQIKLQELIEKLSKRRLPCPFDGCSRPYFHATKSIIEAIKKPDFFSNPIPLLTVLNSEIKIFREKHLLKKENRKREYFDAELAVIEEYEGLTKEAATSLLTQTPLSPKSEGISSDYEPTTAAILEEYLSRQTPWGLRDNLKTKKLKEAEKHGEFDVSGYILKWEHVLKEIATLKEWPKDHKDIKPLPKPDISKLNDIDSKQKMDIWECDTFNKRRELARRLGIAPKLTLSCSKFPPQEHQCWWNDLIQEKRKNPFSPLSLSFWYVHNFLSSMGYAPKNLEIAATRNPEFICKPNPILVKLQLEERRERIANHLIDKKLEDSWDKELKEALALFEKSTEETIKREEQVLKEAVRIDKRLYEAFRRFQKREPKGFFISEEPFILEEDTESLVGENAAYFKIQESSEVAQLVQKAGPDDIATTQNFGSYQRELFKEELEEEEESLRKIGESRITKLYRDFKSAKEKGDERLNELPMHRFIFPEFEKITKSTEDKDLFKRRERYERVKTRANRSRDAIKEIILKPDLLKNEDEDY